MSRNDGYLNRVFGVFDELVFLGSGDLFGEGAQGFQKEALVEVSDDMRTNRALISAENDTRKRIPLAEPVLEELDMLVGVAAKMVKPLDVVVASSHCTASKSLSQPGEGDVKALSIGDGNKIGFVLVLADLILQDTREDIDVDALDRAELFTGDLGEPLEKDEGRFVSPMNRGKLHAWELIVVFVNSDRGGEQGLLT